MYLLRLDDASEYMDTDKWCRMETLLDKHKVRPIVGVIPRNRDCALCEKYEYNQAFWGLVRGWQSKGWSIALHGYTHVCGTRSGGINPVFNRSEFAGLPLDAQRQKIRKGVKILKKHRIYPEIFFAPSHTFDDNTLEALRLESRIRIISDTIARDVYFEDGFYFIPQQSGSVRTLPFFKLVTFCYHPNTMSDSDFRHLEAFLHDNHGKFGGFDGLSLTERRFDVMDWLLRCAYFGFRKVRHTIPRR